MSEVPGAREVLPDFQLLFESAPALLLVLTPDLRIRAATDAYLRATMTTREAIVGRELFDVFPDNPDDPHATGTRNLRDSLERVIRTRAPDTMAVQKYDVARPADAGGGFEERYWSPQNSPVFDSHGELRFITHRAEDVTEYVRQRGVDSARADRMAHEVVVRGQALQEANSQLRDIQAELEQRVEVRTAELATVNEALKDEIAQSRRLEEQFRQAQKMEAIGTLAGGIAHDFNNLLTVICGCAEMLLDEDGPPADARDLTEQIRRSGERAASLTRQLLAFSRQQVLAPQLLDVNTVVLDTDKMLRRLIGADVSLTTALSAEPMFVKADPGQLEQVIMNLAVNARDAMPRGGQLTIETAPVTLDEAYARHHAGVAPGDYVMLAVSDTGTGMDAATQRRIFDPFFTTKAPGKGTGLGLSTVFGIVKQSGGHVWVYSEPGRGATFKVYLPAVSGEDRTAQAKLAPVVPVGTETILVAEDEADVRAWTVLSLRSLGYTVMEAANGLDAVMVSEAFEGDIDVLVSDVVMPEMDGRRAAERILDRRPTLKILYLSGYTDDAVVRHGILREEVAFLQKPFTRLALGRKIRTILDT